jgi:putative endonuclease
MDRKFYVYIVTNKTNTVLYSGFSSSFDQDASQPRNTLIRGLASSYNADRLVYFETFKNAYDAVSRQKQFEGYSRGQKARLIESTNPEWKDLRDRILQSG